MARIYKVVSGGKRGKCGCGHRKHKGDPYWVIDGERTAKSLCDACGVERGLRGAKVTAEELQRYWFDEEPLKEVVCVKLRRFEAKSKNSSKKEEELEAAVEV